MAEKKIPGEIIQEYANDLRHQLGERVKDLVLWESRSRGDNRKNSDYDCLIVLSENNSENVDEIDRLSTEYMDKYDSIIVPIIRGSETWEQEQRLPLGILIDEEGLRV